MKTVWYQNMQKQIHALPYNAMQYLFSFNSFKVFFWALATTLELAQQYEQHENVVFLAVQDSSIGDNVSQSVIK